VCKNIFVRKLLESRLSSYKYDIILDYSDHFLVLLNDTPGMLFIQIKEDYFYVFFRSKGKVTLIDKYKTSIVFKSKPNLRVVK
jgi:hypothetical protein